MRIVLDIDQGVIRDPGLVATIASAYLQGSVVHNRLVLRLLRSAGRPLPPLYRSRVVYRPEPANGSGIEEFASIRRVFLRGWGDCDDLVPIRVAELQEQGEAATQRFYWRRTPRGDLSMHVQVRRANGEIEDPSRLLGM